MGSWLAIASHYRIVAEKLAKRAGAFHCTLPAKRLKEAPHILEGQPKDTARFLALLAMDSIGSHDEAAKLAVTAFRTAQRPYDDWNSFPPAGEGP